jgi:hypothetical protein
MIIALAILLLLLLILPSVKFRVIPWQMLPLLLVLLSVEKWHTPAD